MNIADILGPDYIKKYNIAVFPTLFPPTWSNIKIDRCPFCNIKLRFPLTRNIVFCPSKKHSKFFMSKKTFIDLKTKINEKTKTAPR